MGHDPVVVIDADSHIEDGPDMWRHLDPEYQDRRPHIVDVTGVINGRPDRDKVWLIDGEIYPKLMGHGATCYGTPATTRFAQRKPISPGGQDLSDLGARLAAMDRSGVDISVIFSTLFLEPVSGDVLFEAALMRAYNSWLATRRADADGRLQWAAPIPLRHPPAAVDELRRAKELGAVGVMVLGTAGNMLLHDRRLDPVWAEAERLGLPVCIHVGWAHTALHDTCESPASALMITFELSMVKALFSLLAGGVLDRFPDLRVAFVEGALDWYLVAARRMEHWYDTPTAQPWPAAHRPTEYLANCQIYFTCEGDEQQLPELVGLVGADRILASADFPHVHFEGGRVIDSIALLRARNDLTEDEKRRFIHDNPRRFFGLDSEVRARDLVGDGLLDQDRV